MSAARGSTRKLRAAPGELGLSPLETDVVVLLATGLTLAKIAAKLDTSRASVGNASARAYAKLGVHSSVEAVAEARRRGIVQP